MHASRAKGCLRGARVVLVAAAWFLPVRALPAQPAGGPPLPARVVYAHDDFFGRVFDATLAEAYPSQSFQSEPLVGNKVGGAAPFRHKLLVKLPEFIGGAAGQVPPGSEILEARLVLTSLVAHGEVVAAYELVEGSSNPPTLVGNAPGKLRDAVSWLFRRSGGTPWTVPGAGFAHETTRSRSAAPLDVQVVNQSFAEYAFDVTAAVQHWVDDPSSNHGILFESPSPSVVSFQSTEEFGDAGPRLEVSFAHPLPPLPPALEVLPPAASPFDQAFLEGTTGIDATAVTVAGPSFETAATRLSPTRWYAWVPRPEGMLSMEVEVRAVGGTGATASRTVSVFFAPADLTSEATVSGIAGRGLLLAATSSDPSAVSVTLDPGNGEAPQTGTPGEAFAYAYATPGSFTATASIKDAMDQEIASASAEIEIVEVEFDRPFVVVTPSDLRELAAVVRPTGAATPVHFGATDERFATLGSTLPAGTGFGGDLVQIEVFLQEGGAPLAEARLGGAAGPIVAHAHQVHGHFPLTTYVVAETPPDGGGALGAADRSASLFFRIDPFTPGIDVSLAVLGGFEGEPVPPAGTISSRSFASDDFVQDEEGSEISLAIRPELMANGRLWASATLRFETLFGLNELVGGGTDQVIAQDGGTCCVILRERAFTLANVGGQTCPGAVSLTHMQGTGRVIVCFVPPLLGIDYQLVRPKTVPCGAGAVARRVPIEIARTLNQRARCFDLRVQAQDATGRCRPQGRLEDAVVAGSGKIIVRGTVVRKSDGSPVREALVFLTLFENEANATNEFAGRSVDTDANGRFGPEEFPFSALGACGPFPPDNDTKVALEASAKKGTLEGKVVRKNLDFRNRILSVNVRIQIE